MFTGLVQEVGTVAHVRPAARGGLRLGIEAPAVAERSSVGDSVAVDGVCLTAVTVDGPLLEFDAVPETIARSSLGALGAGARVNLEAALRAGEALGGHYVQGHVDGVGAIRSVDAEGAGRRVWVDVPRDLLRYVVSKGSITVSGTSLTVADLDERGVAVALIPHTLQATTFGALAAGDPVNLEVDVLAKYVERLLRPRAGEPAPGATVSA